MEKFILDNVDRYNRLVAMAKPSTFTKLKRDEQPSEDITVSVRIRPLLKEEVEGGYPASVFVRPKRPGIVDVHDLKHAIRGPPTLNSSFFEVDRAFGPEDTTEQIYDNVVKDLIPWAWGGGLSTLFAYGQTGSGKTFTVIRLQQLVAQSLMEGGLEGKRRVYVSIIELAGNKGHDLLNSRKPVSVLEDSFGTVQLAGAREQLVTSTDDILSLIEDGRKYRQTESTEQNDESSRSHAICRIRIEVLDVPNVEDGLLYLIDLAGSEVALDRASHTADRMKESREINTSLSVLKTCIRGKVESDSLRGSSSTRKAYVPFRQSALTKVLKHVLDPSSLRTSKTTVIACVSPNLINIGANKNTLRYAEMLRVFVPKRQGAKFNPDAPLTWSNEQLKAWVGENSGTPPVDANILAPTESGSFILRLPAPEFESRCRRTPGVTLEQARAFRSKIWRMHIDSQHAKAITPLLQAGESAEEDTVPRHLDTFDASSSRDNNSDTKTIPFKERLRPGMVVSWKPLEQPHNPVQDSLNIVVILCPATAVDARFRDDDGKRVQSPDQPKGERDGRYLCAVVSLGMLGGAYDVHLWRHVVVDVRLMTSEVILEYDDATRYYYIAV